MKKITKINLLLTFALLYTRGFPTSYIIDKNYNIIGKIDGSVNYLKQLDTIIMAKHKLCSLKIIGDVDNTNSLAVINNSFKALIAYLNNDNKMAYLYSLKSKQFGSYFFNNYMLYSYFKSIGKTDSMGYYKKRALKYDYNINRMIYKYLIDSIKRKRKIINSQLNV